MSDRRSPEFRVEDAFVSPPDLDAVIWRYMKLERFAWMLEERALYFSSVERFEDAHEGALTEIEDQEFSATYDETVRSAARYHTVTFSRRRVMANCWHLNPHESAAMWKLYAGTEKAVAIQSTFRRLQQAVAYAAVGVGVVRYVDHETGRTHVHPFYGPYMHKRLWYQDEHEVRAIVYNRDKGIPDGGVAVSVDLQQLITGVVVRREPAGLVEQVRRATLKHELRVPVRTSALDSPPKF
jgi:hypothetical protein